MLAIARGAGLVMLLPGIVLGAVLPYLMRLLEADPRQPSERIGRLIAADTTGAILGSLSAGFLLLPTVGAWRSLLLLAGLYLVTLTAIALSRFTVPRLMGAGLAVAMVILFTGINLETLQAVPIGTRASDRVVEVQEGSHATVAVVDAAGGGRAIRVNTYYTLGSSRNLHLEQNQTVVPLMLHLNPDSVFYLGMGTGITAGAALAFPVERVVVCELLPEVVALSQRHFTAWTRGLFEDERVTVYAEDGRNCLSRSGDRYNMIISDLFTPWERGTGNLYTLENYRMAKERLESDGMFVQWVPLYQVSQREFGIIARTMAEVFPQVVLWRGDLAPSRSIVALVGQNQAQPLEPQVIARQGRQLVNQLGVSDRAMTDDDDLIALLLRLYVGNITASGLFDDSPLNTDHYPLIEYLAPQTHRQVQTGATRFLVGSERERLYEELRAAVTPEADPYLANLTPAQYGDVVAGHYYSRSAQLSDQGNEVQARLYLEKFQALSPPDAVRNLSPARVLLSR
ncbi:spermidine synthase [Egbenema bharatensis]|uniref:spermidine synthase n=1 Tax=Egbenema bharatensis TaxID=3463334 RepID=UPI003A86178F